MKVGSGAGVEGYEVSDMDVARVSGEVASRVAAAVLAYGDAVLVRMRADSEWGSDRWIAQQVFGSRGEGEPFPGELARLVDDPQSEEARESLQRAVHRALRRNPALARELSGVIGVPSDGTSDGTIVINAQAADHSRQAILAQGSMHVHFHAESQKDSGFGEPKLDPFTVGVAPEEMVGREQEIQSLIEDIEKARSSGRPVVVSAVSGMAGVGKTALVRAAAERMADTFPDARLEVDLLGFTPNQDPRTADDVLADLLYLVGIKPVPTKLETKNQFWKAWLAPRSVLLLLDNARTVEQITPLLPGADSRGSVVLITSRHGLADLSAAIPVKLGPLSEEQAVMMLRQGAPSTAEQTAPSTWKELAERCGGLPLLLEAVRNQLSEQTPETLLELLREEEGLHSLAGIPEVEKRIKTAFKVSYKALDKPLRRFLRACGLHPGPDFDARSLAALTGTKNAKARFQLGRLHSSGMIISKSHGRYTFHDLFLTYARELTDRGSDMAQKDLNALYRTLADSADAAINTLTTGEAPGGSPFRTAADARQWLVGATGELRSTARDALAHRSPHAPDLVRQTTRWLMLVNRPDQAQSLYQQARELYEETGARHDLANALAGLGATSRMRNEYRQADAFYTRARELYEETEDRQGLADTLAGLGETARMLSEYDKAAAFYNRARELYETIGDRHGQAVALQGLGDTARMRNDYESATRFLAGARDLYEAVSDRHGQAKALAGLGETSRLLSRFEKAVEFLEQARELYEKIGDRHGQAYTLKGLGDTARMQNHHEDADEFYTRSHELYKKIFDQRGQAHTLAGLGETALMADEYDRAVESYARARELYEQIGDLRGQAYALKGFGHAARLRGEYDRAVAFYTQAGDLYERIGDRRGRANTLFGLGEVARMHGEYDRAAVFYAQADELYEALGEQRGKAKVVLGNARLAETRGEREAAALYARAAQKYRELGIDYWADHCADKSVSLGSDGPSEEA